MLGRRLTYANVTATLALFLALGGGAYALTGSGGSGAVLHGCVSNATGVLRVVSSASACHKRTHRPGSGETAITWNQQGPQGPAGAPGAPGAAGAQGARGLPGPEGAPATALWAIVGKSDEILSASDPSITSRPSGVGAFVDFHEDIEGCAVEASDGEPGSATAAEVQAAVQAPSEPTVVRVDYRNVAEGFRPPFLNVAVFC